MIKNAIIKNTRLSIENYGCLTAWLELDYGGCEQGFGGYMLYLPKSFKHHRLESVTGHFIYRVLEVAGVSSWDDLVGKSIRVNSSANDKIVEIGHIIKDIWFNPEMELSSPNE